MSVKIDYKQFAKFVELFERMNKEFEIFLHQFLIKEAEKCLANTKRLTPVKTGDLRERWRLSGVRKEGNDLVVDLINPMEYASFVEDGHMQYNRFVPGSWLGGEFEYIPGYPFGMVLQTKWIPGVHMARISITKAESAIPGRFQKDFNKWIKGLGVA